MTVASCFWVDFLRRGRCYGMPYVGLVVLRDTGEGVFTGWRHRLTVGSLLEDDGLQGGGGVVFLGCRLMAGSLLQDAVCRLGRFTGYWRGRVYGLAAFGLSAELFYRIWGMGKEIGGLVVYSGYRRGRVYGLVARVDGGSLLRDDGLRDGGGVFFSG